MRRISICFIIILSCHMQLNELNKKLFEAIEEGNIDEVKILLKNGADINTRKENGLSPLHQAIWAKKKEIAKYLILNGADVNTKGYKYGDTPLIDAVVTLDKEIVELLISKGARVNDRDKSRRYSLESGCCF